MMYRSTILVMTLFLGAALGPGTAHAKLDVVATVPDLAALAREVGGDRVSITTLSLPTQDPHWVDAKPSLTLRLNKADLLLAVGLELEIGWLPTLQTGARNARVQRSGRGFLECAGHVELRGVPTGPIDRSMGDVHPGGNPHYLFDPRAARACARAIAARMSELDPAGAQAYRANLDAFAKRLDRRIAEWERRMAPFRGTRIITYHASWLYLTEWLGLVEIATLEPKPGIAPSPSHVARVIRLGREQQAKLLLQEAFYPSKTGALVASKLGAKLVAVPGGTNVERGQSYIEHIEEIIAMLEKALT